MRIERWIVNVPFWRHLRKLGLAYYVVYVSLVGAVLFGAMWFIFSLAWPSVPRDRFVGGFLLTWALWTVVGSGQWYLYEWAYRRVEGEPRA